MSGHVAVADARSICAEVAEGLRIVRDELRLGDASLSGDTILRAAALLDIFGARRPDGTLAGFDEALFVRARSGVGRDGLLAELVQLTKENQRLRAAYAVANDNLSSTQGRCTELLLEVRRLKSLVGHAVQFVFDGHLVHRLGLSRHRSDSVEAWAACDQLGDREPRFDSAVCGALDEALAWVRARGVEVPT